MPRKKSKVRLPVGFLCGSWGPGVNKITQLLATSADSRVSKIPVSILVSIKVLDFGIAQL
ncbi:hypothetical protein UM93_05920 [Psychromicrobium lacuslunae]|uniref:Uncharacterized protein n=1 Tax=Psychromicrobium lacuslunae TaxID=1618207 RepID=A0A0D4BXI7_9MICC|nr:hypothetical protein UM93_05920 [Psychromicrobium lacuslunae]